MSNPISPREQYYGTKKVASLFDVTQETVIVWIKEGKLDAVKINNRWKVPKSAIVSFGEAKYSPS